MIFSSINWWVFSPYTSFYSCHLSLHGSGDKTSFASWEVVRMEPDNKGCKFFMFNFKNYNPGVRLRDQRKKMQSPQLSFISFLFPLQIWGHMIQVICYNLWYNICYMFLSYMKKYSKRTIPMTMATITKIIKKLTSKEMYRTNLHSYYRNNYWGKKNKCREMTFSWMTGRLYIPKKFIPPKLICKVHSILIKLHHDCEIWYDLKDQMGE